MKIWLSKLLEQDLKIYSFCHSRVIKIFKITDNTNKLKKTKRHSSINVSLTYLRGVKIPKLTQNDIPVV
jgi:hypothetical protein